MSTRTIISSGPLNWISWSSELIPTSSLFSAGFPAAYAAYAAGRGYSGYPSFGLPYPTGNLNLATIQDHLNSQHHSHLSHHHHQSASSNGNGNNNNHHTNNNTTNHVNNSANTNHCNNATGSNPLLHQLITSSSCHPLLQHNHHHSTHHHQVPLDGSFFPHPPLNRHNHPMHLWTERALLATTAALIASSRNARRMARGLSPCCHYFACSCSCGC